MRATNPTFTRILFCAALAFASLQVESAAATPRDGRDQKAANTGPRARIGLDMKIADAQIVRAGFRLAITKIREVPTCGQLFAPLDLSGETALLVSSYALARPGAERALCDRGALAVTRVGRTQVRLCPNFTRLSKDGVAAYLIHEALHTAGLGEYPVDPEGPTSAAITRVVLKACSLGRTGRGAERAEVMAEELDVPWLSRASRSEAFDPSLPAEDPPLPKGDRFRRQ